MESFTRRGKTFYVIDENTVLCPMSEKYLVSEGLEEMVGEMMKFNLRLASLIALKAEEGRIGH